MKGINIQFDTLVQFIQKNASNHQVTKNRDSFQIVYQKVTQQAMKIVVLVFDNLVDDQSLKLSFQKLNKQLKSFLALKPSTEQDEDQFFNKQFDEVQQFMNNRKPVVAEVDNMQRGDIVKFLFQAENKEKDIEEFMGNIKNVGGLGGVVRKLKTMKNIAVVMEDVEVQTALEMEYLERLEKRMPSLFSRVQEAGGKVNGLDAGGQEIKENAKQQQQQVFDLDAHIDQMIKQKVKQAQELAQPQQLENQKQKQRTKSQKQQKQKQQQGKKKKLQPGQKQRNSEISTNNKKSSLVGGQQVGGQGKGKSGFNSNSSKEGNKKGLTAIVDENNDKKEQKTAANSSANSAESFQGNEGKCESYMNGGGNYTINNSANIQSAMPSFQQIFSTLAGVKGIQGVSEQQMKLIYQSIKVTAAQSLKKSPLFLKPQTLQQQCNTHITYQTTAITDEFGKIITNQSQSNQISIKRKKGKNFGKTNTSNMAGDNNKGEINEKGGEDGDEEDEMMMEPRYRTNSKGVRFDVETKRCTAQDLLINQQGLEYGHTLSKSGLPTISKHVDGDITNKPQKSDSTSILLKQGKSAQGFLKKLKDSKYLKPVNPSKSINKQNYTLDMYKSKLQTKNRASQHINLPSLSRNGSNPKVGISLHDESIKSSYLKKNPHLSTNDPLFPSTHTQSQGFFKKGPRGQKTKEISKEQQKIMKELQRIVKEGAVMSHMKHIAMYVQFVESVHVRKCGERCVHLERFYDFLRKNNLPNRKELVLNRTDMNVNVEI